MTHTDGREQPCVAHPQRLVFNVKNFIRSFTVKEFARLMSTRPADLAHRPHEMGIYKHYFDLIASGRKTTEIRVNDASRRKIRPGSLIRFTRRDEKT